MDDERDDQDEQGHAADEVPAIFAHAQAATAASPGSGQHDNKDED